jgi:hypothetical protein
VLKDKDLPGEGEEEATVEPDEAEEAEEEVAEVVNEEVDNLDDLLNTVKSGETDTDRPPEGADEIAAKAAPEGDGIEAPPPPPFVPPVFEPLKPVPEPSKPIKIEPAGLRVAIVGPPLSGKSTLSYILSKVLNLRHVDPEDLPPMTSLELAQKGAIELAAYETQRGNELVELEAAAAQTAAVLKNKKKPTAKEKADAEAAAKALAKAKAAFGKLPPLNGSLSAATIAAHIAESCAAADPTPLQPALLPPVVLPPPAPDPLKIIPSPSHIQAVREYEEEVKRRREALEKERQAKLAAEKAALKKAQKGKKKKGVEADVVEEVKPDKKKVSKKEEKEKQAKDAKKSKEDVKDKETDAA